MIKITATDEDDIEYLLAQNIGGLTAEQLSELSLLIRTSIRNSELLGMYYNIVKLGSERIVLVKWTTRHRVSGERMHHANHFVSLEISS